MSIHSLYQIKIPKFLKNSGDTILNYPRVLGLISALHNQSSNVPVRINRNRDILLPTPSYLLPNLLYRIVLSAFATAELHRRDATAGQASKGGEAGGIPSAQLK